MSFLPADPTPKLTVPVYRACDFRVVIGANEGDGLGIADDLVLDDTYRVAPQSSPDSLTLSCAPDGAHAVALSSEAGQPGASVHIDCVLSLMAPGAPVTEALVLVEVDAASHVAEIYLLPLSPLLPGAAYQLVGLDTAAAWAKFAQISCAAFARGTQITLGSGRQCPVEDLKIGDPVLTRNDGVQQIRWIGRSTHRATGEFAPVRIAAGALNNAGDLLVSQDHRLFIYQRRDRLGAGRSELTVRARHLVNGRDIMLRPGGFIDYFQIIFDRHQIIFAEGIAAESMRVDARTASLLPEEIARDLTGRPSDGRGTGRFDIDVPEDLLQRADAADLLRRASAG
jgi:hypothetical protein